jgi:hypothetical protein
MTFDSRTELLFPPRLIKDLKGLRGEAWKELVEYLISLPETHPDTLAFCLMMIRLNSCLNCFSGSYRFMRGCELCAQQTIARFQGTDEDLIALYEQAKQDLARYRETPDAEIELVPDTPEPEILE